MMRMSNNMKKICGLGFCFAITVIVVFFNVGGQSGGRFDRAQTGCTCHNDINPNPDPSVIITLNGLPVEYTPLTTYSLTITVSGGVGTTRGGYNLEVSAGTLTNPGPNSQIDTPPVQATHTNENQRSWTVDWVAPSSGTGTVTFWIAGLTAAGNTNANGDLWNLYSTTVDELVVANNPPEARDLSVQGFADGTTGIMHITDHTPDLGWTFTDPDGGDSQQQYDVRVGTGSGLSDMWAPGPQSGGTSSVVYAGLTLMDNTDYWFGVRVNDGTEWSVWNETLFHMNSLEAQSMTVQGFSDGTSGILHITDHTPDLAWIFWDGEGDTQTQYEIRVGTQSSLSDMWAPGGQGGASTLEVYAGSPLLDGTDYYFGIRVNDGFEWSAWNEVKFHMNSLEARNLTVTGFLDGTQGIMHIEDHTPDLAWTFWDGEADSQTQFEIRVGTQSGFSDMWSYGPVGGPSTSEIYAGSSLLDGTDYYFGIRVYDGFEWSAWNEVKFHMNNLSEAIDLTVEGFTDGTPGIMHIKVANPQLGWTFFDPEVGETQKQYQVRIGSSSGASDIWGPPAQVGPTNSVTYAGPPLVDGTDYWFGVSVFDGFEWSAWNETKFHTNAIPQTHSLSVSGYVNGTVGIMHIVDHTPGLGWTFLDMEITDAQTQFEIRVGTAPGLFDMWNPGVMIGASSSVVYNGSGLDDGVNYWFQIRVYDGYEWSNWNDTMFHINTPPPAPTFPINPADDSYIPSSPAQTLDWTPGGSDSDGDVIEYWWYVDTDMPPIMPYLDNGTTMSSSSNPFSTNPATDYYWYVNATDGWEWTSSVVWNFTTSAIVNNPPEAIDLLISGFSEITLGITHIIDHTPLFEWSFTDPDGGDVQTRYQVRVGTGTGLSNKWAPPEVYSGSNSEVYGGSPLLDGTDYWFAVRIYDGNTWSAWNETQFHMNSVEARDPSVSGFLDATAGIMHIVNHTPNLAWTFWDGEADSQTQYEIRVGTQSGFSDRWSYGPVGGPATSEIYLGLTLFDGTDYYFGIRVNDSYEWSQWIEVPFHMNALPPAPTPPLNPLDDSNIPSSPAQTLSWSSGGVDPDGDSKTYYWYIDTDLIPVAPYVASGITGGLSSSSFSTSPSVDYYWIVNVTDGWEWNSSIIWNFTTSSFVNNPPEALGLSVSGYTDGTTGIMHIIDHTPDFTWSFFDLDGGDSQQKYEIRVGTQSGFDDMWATGPLTGTALMETYNGSVLSDGTDYYFGIRLYDGNTWSVWNETLFHMNGLPPIPVPPLNPPDDATIPESPAQTLSWTAGGVDSEGDTITYWWYIDTKNPPDFPFIANGTTTGTSSTSFTTVPGTNYYWIINVTDGWEWTSTVIWNFTTAGSPNIPPEARDLLVSGFGESTSGILHITDHTPDLSWSFFDLDSGDFQQKYEVRVGTASGLFDMWNSGSRTGGENSIVYAGSPLVDGRDYWFGILVYDGIEWSTLNETMFHMNSKPVAQYLTVSGFFDGTTDIMHIINHTPDLDWSFSDFEVGDSQNEYEIRVGTSSGSSNMWATGILSGGQTSVVYGGLSLVDGIDYWFGIRVYDGYEWSTWNQTKFHMNSLPIAPIEPIDPVHGSVIFSDSQQKLSWTEGGSDSEGDTITFYWYIDTDNPPTAPYLANNFTLTSQSTAFATVQSTVYFWFVNATDGWEWNWTQVWSFTTQSPPNSLPEVKNLNVQGFFEGNPDIIHITDHTPTLGWTFFDSDSSDAQVKYEIRVGTYSGSSDMWNFGPVDGNANQVTYLGSELADGEDYWFGIRVFDGKDWSYWEEINFHMNALSEVYDLTVDGFSEGATEISHIFNSSPVLGGSYSDGDGGYTQQRYEVRIGSASGRHDMWLSGPQDGAFNGIIYNGLPLLEDTDYWYALRVFDRYEWSEWEEIMFHIDYPATLDWTGDANYISDGVNPDSGDSSTTFVFMIKYTDLGNSPPPSGNPNLIIKKDGVQISLEPFTMNYESGAYSQGAIYTYSIILEKGTNYTYYFGAVDGQAYHLIMTEEKQGPSVINDTIEILPPLPPTNVIVTTPNERGKLTISWDASSDEDIAGYIVYRLTDDNEYEPIKTFDALTTSYTDSDLDDEMTYKYRIKAVDSNGIESEYSQEAQGTTIAEPQDIDDQKEDEEDSWLNLWIILLSIIVVILIILILVYLKRRGKYKEEEPLFYGKSQETQEGEKLTSKTENEAASPEVQENSSKTQDESQSGSYEEDLPPPDDE